MIISWKHDLGGPPKGNTNGQGEWRGYVRCRCNQTSECTTAAPGLSVAEGSHCECPTAMLHTMHA